MLYICSILYSTNQQIIPPVMLLDAPLSYRALTTVAMDKQAKLPTVMAPSTSRTCD